MSNFENYFLKSYEILKNTKDLSPRNKEICEILSKLVKHANDCYECKLDIKLEPKTHELIPSFRNICSTAEAEMEKYWSDYFTSKKDLTINSLKEFWYFDNYEKITNKEISLIEKYFPNNKNIHVLFAGSGALPLSAILMYVKGFKNITLIDIDSKAVNKSRKLLSKLKIPITVRKQDIFEHSLHSYDLVCIASLIPNKELIIKKIKNENIRHYMMRGVDGIYQIFYEDLSENIKNSSTYIYCPSDIDTINSSYLFKNY